VSASTGPRKSTSDSTVIVLAMHGSPPLDFPGPEFAEFMRLHTMQEQVAARDERMVARCHAIEEKLRNWPRTEQNDPYWAASLRLKAELARATGLDVVVGFNEFRDPDLRTALEQAAESGAARVVVVTPMMTRGGEHSERDIPEAVEVARQAHPQVRFDFVWPLPESDVAEFLAGQVRSFLARPA